MTKFRKTTALLLMICLLCSCTPTSGSPDASSETPTPPGVENSEELPDENPGDTALDLSAVSSPEFARLMGYGINLGNTMEACDSSNRTPNQETSVYETMWGQTVTTQAMVTGMKNAGFKTLRIPVAWTNAMDFENGDYTIGEAYLNRVAEIIDYALNVDMYVIINDHWDHGWWSMFSHADSAVREQAMEIFSQMWTQIAERYRDYDERVVFEAANEELGNRFNDKTPFNPEGGKLTQDECYALLTTVTQTFVDIVRAAGGSYNNHRFLLIPGYNTDFAATADDRFTMPTDTADSKLMLSVHYYTPWSYCGDTSGVGVWGTTSEVEEQNALMELMTKYTDMGYGIVIGEWGVLDNVGEDRYSYFFNFLNNCDLYGYSPILWDTGGLFDRAQGIIADPDDEAIDKLAKLFHDRSIEARADMTVEDIIVAAQDNIAWSLRKAASRPEVVIEADQAFAWIMFSSGDWSVQYSVGDVYKPESITEGMVATDAEVTAGAGTYEIGLDFTGTAAGYADGIVFSAVGIMNGEILFPGYYVEIKEIKINGEIAALSGKPYTTADNIVCTRVNLHNTWVSDVPPEARVADGDLTGATPSPLIDYIDTKIETLTVVFDYIGE